MSAPAAPAVVDRLGVASDATLSATLTRFRRDKNSACYFPCEDPVFVDERVLFSDKIVKINRKGKRQERVLIVTTHGVFNFGEGKYKKVKRRINILDLGQMYTASNEGTIFVLHRCVKGGGVVCLSEPVCV
jgi:hypothetical protein